MIYNMFSRKMAGGISAEGSHFLQLFWLIAIHLASVWCQDTEEISYPLREQVPYDTHIGNVIEDSNLKHLYSRSVLTTFQFGLLQGRHNNYFQINNNGDFSTADPLNREDVCPSMDICEIVVKAAVLRPPQYFTEILIQVTVLDRNDYTPTFAQSKLVINMSESTLPGAEFVIPPAIDLDSARFGIQSYEIKPPVEEFELLISSNSDGTQDLRLKLKERLDRENNARYTINIVVYDGGEPPKHSTMEIEVNLLDHNDNSPVFDKTLYNITVNEDFALDTTLLQVHATDADDGLNGLVRYSLAAQTTAVYGDLFYIDSATGAVMLGEHLDYEQHTLYTLVIEANDHGVGSLPAIAKVYLHVRDVNDHEPSLTVSGLSPSGEIEIAEQSDIDVPIAHISVEDLDIGSNGEVECSTPNSNDFFLRQRQGSTFMVVSARSYDYETKRRYNLPIICRDHGTPPLSTSVDIAIAIVDVNDNTPIFDTNVYLLELEENNTVGATLLQVTASDQDSNDNGRLTYVLNGGASDYVQIDPDTGIIRAKVAFDYEQTHGFDFNVTAYDNGVPRKSDTAMVKIILIDKNDEVPRFSQTEYSFGTFENQEVGTEIGTIQATDADSPPYDTFVFTLDTHSNAISVFDIDPTSGEITTRRMLDREHVPTYYLTVVATNTAFPRLSATVNVTVYVVDRNDNAPLITFPSQENNTVQVHSNAARGSIFTRIIASDSDLGKNAKLEFSIASGDDDGLFAVDSMTGAVSVQNDLSEADQSTYELLIMVKDLSEEERKSAVTTLHIFINRTVTNKKDDSQSGSSIQDSHKTAIIILGAVTAVLVVILVTAIIIIKRRQAVHLRRSTESMYKVEVAHHNGPDGAGFSQEKQVQGNATVAMEPMEKRPDDHVMSDRTHLTLEDIKRMKCLYRNTPDVARHTAPEVPDTRAHVHNHGQAYNVRKNAEMQGIFDLLSDGEGQPIDDESTDSNADSGRGTSEAGNDTSAQRINLSDDRPAIINRQGILTPVHMYLKEKPSVLPQRPRDTTSTFGSHLNRHDRQPPPSYSEVENPSRKQQHHVTFDLSNQSNPPTLPHKQYNKTQTPVVNHSNQPFQRTKNSVGSSSQFKNTEVQGASPYIDMTQSTRRNAPNVAIYSNPSEVSESCDNLSLASTTSGEYIVQLENGPLQSVEV